MAWERMSMEEMARCQQAEGLTVLNRGGVWWVEIRPFFFRPLLPFTFVDPRTRPYPGRSIVGGYLHAVPDGVEPNSAMNLFVYHDLKRYNIDSLSYKRRKTIRNAQRVLEVREFQDSSDFLGSAYDVYLSFQKRTGYGYKAERVHREAFARWGKSLFERPKVRKVGVYLSGRLCAVETSYFVEDVIIGDTLFADEAGLAHDVTDLLYHTIREEAAATDARYIFLGFPTGVRSLDRSKFERGCRLLSLPARYCVNPLTLAAVKLLMRPSYQKLLEITAPSVVDDGRPQRP